MDRQGNGGGYWFIAIVLALIVVGYLIFYGNQLKHCDEKGGALVQSGLQLVCVEKQ